MSPIREAWIRPAATALSAGRRALAGSARRARPDEYRGDQRAGTRFPPFAATRNSELLAGALALDADQRHDFQRAARTAAARRKASVTVGPWPQAGAPVVPITVTSYVGRETDTAAITELLKERRFVTLTGEGGIGKTRAALQAVAALGDWEFSPCSLA